MNNENEINKVRQDKQNNKVEQDAFKDEQFDKANEVS